MKTLLRLLLGLVAVVVLLVVIVYAAGAAMPLDHVTSVTGVVEASPARVFALITNVGAAPYWRHEVKSVKVLDQDQGRDHWIEDLGHGQTMTFLATHTILNTRRDVLLDVPGATYGGTWTYELTPGITPDQTNLKITETGFIKPPVYRFLMGHVLGMTHNLDQYMKEMQLAAKA